MSEFKAVGPTSVTPPIPCARVGFDFAAEEMSLIRVFPEIPSLLTEEEVLPEVPRTFFANSVRRSRALEVEGEIGVSGSGFDLDLDDFDRS